MAAAAGLNAAIAINADLVVADTRAAVEEYHRKAGPVSSPRPAALGPRRARVAPGLACRADDIRKAFRPRGPWDPWRYANLHQAGPHRGRTARTSCGPRPAGRRRHHRDRRCTDRGVRVGLATHQSELHLHLRVPGQLRRRRGTADPLGRRRLPGTLRRHGRHGRFAHVSAYGNSNICTVVSWGPSLGDEPGQPPLLHLSRCRGGQPLRRVRQQSHHGAARGYLGATTRPHPAAGTTRRRPTRSTRPAIRSRSPPPASARTPSTWARSAPTAQGPGPRPCCGSPRTARAPPMPGARPGLLPRSDDPGGSLLRRHRVSDQHRFVLSYVRGVVPESSTVDNYDDPPTIDGWTSSGGVAPSVATLGEGDYLVSFSRASRQPVVWPSPGSWVRRRCTATSSPGRSAVAR